jgi:hypothetical protein
LIKRGLLISTLLVATSGYVLAQTAVPAPEAHDSQTVPVEPSAEPIDSSGQAKPEGVHWKPLILQSLAFLGIEHAFRYATEPATRHPGRPFFQGYVDSLSALHGWADGDPFYVNYVGHPMQGAVAGFIWVQNDGRFRGVEFGKNRDYWKSRLRAGAYSWIYSTQMEIGPVSEASLGNIQAGLPQQGFVDHVITPAIGLGWQITEDALDRYFVRYLERKTDNRYYRAMFRAGLNPSRSFANVIGGQLPWARPRDQGGSLTAISSVGPSPPASPSTELLTGLPPVEVSVNAYSLIGPNSPCIGGGSTIAFRIHPHWQMVGDVNGCNMTGQENNFSGDSMTFVLGPRWTPILSGRWHPFVQVLGGGNKVTQELLYPELKAALERKAEITGAPPPPMTEYTTQFDSSGWAITAGIGLDYQINNAFSFRVGSVEYTRAWVYDMPHFNAPNGFQVKMGLVLRMGTW